ncbi:group II intron reverse transcriptase/maturase [Flavobacterium sp.]|uniref:group II intron reverse transcriptase/maturase n=1 Tax=Flavobacterium sp. TaxID=239 RepID=UPI0037508B68
MNRSIKHLFYRTHNSTSKQVIIKQIIVKLNCNFMNFFTFTTIHLPTMIQIWTNKNQFYIINFFNMIANNTSNSFSVLNKIDLIFGMIMYRKIKIIFDSIKNQEAITFR